MFIYSMLHPYTSVRFKYTRGLFFPHHGVISPNTSTSAAPRTYSIICIDSDSCPVEKAKTDRHDRARAGRCSRGFFESLKTYAA